MKIVLRGLAFAFLLGVVFYVLVRVPRINQGKVCYNNLMEVYNQKGIVIRHARMTQMEICTNDRELVLGGVDCFRKLTPIIPFFPKESVFLDKMSRVIARATKTELETVNDFNENCPYRNTKIEYDLSLADPFQANFE